MALFLTTFGLVMLLGAAVSFILNDNRLVPRHLLTVFVIAVGIAAAMPQGKYPSGSQSALGIMVAVGGVMLGIGLESRHKRKS